MIDKGIAYLKEFIHFFKTNWDLSVMLFGFCFALPLLITNQYLVVNDNSISNAFLWFDISFSFVGIGSLLFFILYNLKNDESNYRKILFLIVLIIITINIVTTWCNPNEITVTTTVRCTYFYNYGSQIDVITNITNLAKFSYSLYIAIMVLFYFVCLFFLPKKLNDIKFINLLSIILILVFAASIVYSLIVETSNYGLFIDSLIHSSDYDSHPDLYALRSFFAHRNQYGMFIIMTIIACLSNYVISKKKYYIPLAMVLFIYMFFTLCKSGIILVLVGLVIFYFVYHLLQFKTNEISKKYFKAGVAVVGVLFITILVLTLTIEPLRNKVEYLFRYNDTLKTRSNIWLNVIDILKPGWFVTGRGYGVSDSILYNVNSIGLDDYVQDAHSWIFSLLSRGGIVLLLSFIAGIILNIKNIGRALHDNKLFTLTLLLGMSLFFVYSFIESNYYIVVLYLVEISIVCAHYSRVGEIE